MKAVKNSPGVTGPVTSRGRYQGTPSGVDPAKSAFEMAPSEQISRSQRHTPMMSVLIMCIVCDVFCCRWPALPPKWILLRSPVLITSATTHSVLRSMQPRSSMLLSLSMTRGLPSRHSWPVKSFTLSLGASHCTWPRRSRSVSHIVDSSDKSAQTERGARRNFVSDSPSSGFVLTQHWPGGSDPRRSSKSAGKASRARTRTTSPSRTSAHVARTGPDATEAGAAVAAPLESLADTAATTPPFVPANDPAPVPAAVLVPAPSPLAPKRMSTSC
eukprot:6179789-Pleurochrysis_carterae.AAC.5